MELKISKLEVKCQMKVFVEALEIHEAKYRNCYNCDGYTNLFCYVQPNQSNRNLIGDGI